MGSAHSPYPAAHRAPLQFSASYAESAAMWDHALANKLDDADTKVARAFLELDWKADTRPLIPQLWPIETATLLGPAPPRSALRKNRRLPRAERNSFQITPVFSGQRRVSPGIFRITSHWFPFCTPVNGQK
jgi:hypothetical protein